MRLQVSRPSYGKGSQVDTLGSQFIADLLACDEGHGEIGKSRRSLKSVCPWPATHRKFSVRGSKPTTGISSGVKERRPAHDRRTGQASILISGRHTRITRMRRVHCHGSTAGMKGKAGFPFEEGDPPAKRKASGN
jgi:hypothetical protein